VTLWVVSHSIILWCDAVNDVSFNSPVMWRCEWCPIQFSCDVTLWVKFHSILQWCDAVSDVPFNSPVMWLYEWCPIQLSRDVTQWVMSIQFSCDVTQLVMSHSILQWCDAVSDVRRTFTFSGQAVRFLHWTPLKIKLNCFPQRLQ